MGQPPIFKSPNALRRRIDRYFINCEKNGRPYTYSGLALWLDTNRQTLLNYDKQLWGTTIPQEDRDAFSEILQWAKAKCENYAEEQLFLKTGSPHGIIFNLKNNYKWEDKQEFGGTGLVVKVAKYQEEEEKQDDGT